MPKMGDEFSRLETMDEALYLIEDGFEDIEEKEKFFTLYEHENLAA